MPAGTQSGGVNGGPGGPLEVPRIALLEADPELLRHVAGEEALRARRAVTAPLFVLPEGPFDPAEALTTGTNAFAALLLSGLIAREVTVGGQPTLRLLGPGDLILPGPLSSGLLVPEQSWTASLPTRLAVLDDRFLHAVRHWPRLLTALVERTAEHHDATLVQLAISQQPRVEDRLVALFRALSDRWGRMTPQGVVVPLALTHEALGRLIGARRPTVTLALKALGAQERLLRRGDGAWLLADGDLTTLPHRELSPLAGPARPRLVGLGRPTADGAAPPPLPSVPDEGVLVDELERLRGRHESLRDRVSELAERTARNRAVTQSLIRPSD